MGKASDNGGPNSGTATTSGTVPVTPPRPTATASTNSNPAASSTTTSTNHHISELDRLAKARAAGAPVPVPMPSELPLPAPMPGTEPMPNHHHNTNHRIATPLTQEQMDQPAAKARAATSGQVPFHVPMPAPLPGAPPPVQRHGSLGTHMAQQMQPLAHSNATTVPTAATAAPGLVHHREGSIGAQMAEQMAQLAQGNATTMEWRNAGHNNTTTTTGNLDDVVPQPPPGIPGVGVATGIPEHHNNNNSDDEPLPPPPPSSFGGGLLQRARNISVRLRPGAYRDGGGTGPGGFEGLRRTGTFEKQRYATASQNRRPPRRPSRLLPGRLSRQQRQQQQQEQERQQQEQESSKGLAVPGSNHDHPSSHKEGGLEGEVGAISVQGPGDHKQKEDESIHKKRTWIWIAAALLFIVLVIVAIVVGVVVGGSSSSASTTVSDSETAPPTIYLPPVHEVFTNEPLPMATVVAITNDTTSAPYQAYQWLVQDPQWQLYSEPQRRQRFALATLYHATNGDRWFAYQSSPPEQGWLNYHTHECSWFITKGGNPCQGFDATTASLLDHYDYHYLMLQGRPDNDRDSATVYPGLRGQLPDELGLLTALNTLNLGYQNLYGTIPETAWEPLTELQDIRLEMDHLERLPLSFWTHHPKLKHVFLSGNADLEPDVLPSEIGLLQELQILNLMNTNRFGTLPIELFSLPNLEALLLSENDISGTLPSEIGLASNMRDLQLRNNDLFGTIPTQVGQLTMLMDFLQLGANRLSGEIPSELGNLLRLQQLHLGGNALSGLVPTELGLLSNLMILRLSTVDFSNTAISGPLPLELFAQPSADANGMVPSFPKMQELSLGSTQISGSLPSEVGLLSTIQTLRLSDNKNLIGSIPSQIGQLSLLRRFGAYGCQLSGILPSEIGNLLHLRTLNLFGNDDLRGTIPDSLCSKETNLAVGCKTERDDTKSTDICGCDCLC